MELEGAKGLRTGGAGQGREGCREEGEKEKERGLEGNGQERRGGEPAEVSRKAPWAQRQGRADCPPAWALLCKWAEGRQSPSPRQRRRGGGMAERRSLD